jgi:hypothetical protein
MSKQVIIGRYYGHHIEVVIDRVLPEVEMKEIPDVVKEIIFHHLGNDTLEGELTLEDTSSFRNLTGKNTITSLSGHWRVIELNYDLMRSMVLWQNNHDDTEALSKELFVKIFGNNLGNHYYEKWMYLYGGDILKMMCYYKTQPDHGQLFCDMLLKQIRRYEQRL